jgi:hypothetical protein
MSRSERAPRNGARAEAGLVEVTVRVPPSRVEELKRIVAEWCALAPLRTLPGQISMFDEGPAARDPAPQVPGPDQISLFDA